MVIVAARCAARAARRRAKQVSDLTERRLQDGSRGHERPVASQGGVDDIEQKIVAILAADQVALMKEVRPGIVGQHRAEHPGGLAGDDLRPAGLLAGLRVTAIHRLAAGRGVEGHAGRWRGTASAAPTLKGSPAPTIDEPGPALRSRYGREASQAMARARDPLRAGQRGVLIAGRRRGQIGQPGVRTRGQSARLQRDAGSSGPGDVVLALTDEAREGEVVEITVTVGVVEPTERVALADQRAEQRIAGPRVTAVAIAGQVQAQPAVP